MISHDMYSCWYFFLGLLLCLFNVRQSTGGYIPGPASCPQLGLCVTPPWLNCYSQLRHDLQRGFTVTNAMLCHPPTKILKCTAKQSAVCSTNGFIWECKGLATMIKTCQAPDSSHVALSPFSVLPLPLFSPLWRAIACRLLFHVLLQKTAAHQTVRSVAFLLPPLTCYQSCNTGKSLGWTTLHFSQQTSEIFQPGVVDISVSDQMFEMQRGRGGFDETPIGPLGSARQLMGCWNDIIVIHDPLRI